MNIPFSMRAAVLVGQKSPLQVVEVKLPSRLRFGQVLVKIYFSGICGSQIGEINGVKGKDPFLPHLLGHEGSGEVMAVGEGVRHVAPGNKVVLHWREGVGLEAPLPEYTWDGRKVNAGFVTTFNEYAIVSENRVTPIPSNFPMDIAPLFGCAVTTGLGVINNNAKVKIGESVIVFGAGGIGLNVIQGAAMVSAFPIIAIDVFDSRLKMARRFGATHTINSKIESVREAVLKITGEQGGDVVVDNTGNTEVINLGYELTSSIGRTILVGVPAKGNHISIYSLPLHFKKKITGSHGGETNPSVDIPNYVRLFENDQLNLADLITERVPLEKINAAINGMQTGTISGRCIIEMDRHAS